MTGVTAGLMQGRTEVFAERMQGWHLYVLRYSASIFGNSVSMLIAALGLSGHSNGYRATVAVARNNQLQHHMMGCRQLGEVTNHVAIYLEACDVTTPLEQPVPE